MHGFLYLLSILAFLAAFSIFSVSRSVLHESLAADALICAAVFFSAGAVVQTLNRLAVTLEKIYYSKR